MFVNKSIQIKGNLSNRKLKYRLCPSDEFANGNWYIAISSIYCESTVKHDVICTISTDFVIAKKYNADGQTSSYEEPLGVFHLNLSAPPKSILFKEFSPIWLEMNQLSGTQCYKTFFMRTFCSVRLPCE